MPRKPITDADIGHLVGYDPLDGLEDDTTLASGCYPSLVEFTQPHGWARVLGGCGMTFLVHPENCFSMLPEEEDAS